MTTAIHHGNPGSYKSFCITQGPVIKALEEGRTVVTNIRGLNSIERIEEALGRKMHPDAQIIYVDADSSEGFRAMSVFFHWAPIGALICIDEVQRVYSKKRDRDLKKFDLVLERPDGSPMPDEEVKKLCPLWDGNRDRPHTAENAFDQHRHYNWDIYCSTPNIAKVHNEIREVAEIAYRHKSLGSILPFSRKDWKEFAHDPEESGKQLSHYMGTPKSYAADKRIFACYQSTKTGKALGSSENRSILRDPKLQAVGVAFLGCLVWFVHSTVKTIENGGLVGSDRAEGLYADPALARSGAVAPGGDAGSVPVVKKPAEAQFDELAAAFQGYQRVKLDDPGFDPIADLLARGSDPVLDAVAYMPESGRVVFQVSFYAGSMLVDRFTQYEFTDLGYAAEYRSYGLVLSKGSEQFLVRPTPSRLRARASDEAMRGAGAGVQPASIITNM